MIKLTLNEGHDNPPIYINMRKVDFIRTCPEHTTIGFGNTTFSVLETLDQIRELIETDEPGVKYV